MLKRNFKAKARIAVREKSKKSEPWSTSQETPEKTRGLEVTIEAYTEGDDRRAKALALLREIRPQFFTVAPYYLREISGPNVEWAEPPMGEPIVTPAL
ncbi:MAG: hypothetical protein ACR2KT_13205 [Methylocella sp.]|nr:MAG: hypothetical protein DLM68_01800 [Hyphomicrobiales bacterium]